MAVILAAGNTTSLLLTSAWGVNGSYEHHWNPSWRTSVYGGYAEVSYGTQANAILCSQCKAAATASVSAAAAVATAGCNNDWNVWYVGTRTQWNVTPDFYMGVDVMYQSLQSAQHVQRASCRRPSGSPDSDPPPTFISDEDAVQVEFRVHKDFYP